MGCNQDSGRGASRNPIRAFVACIMFIVALTIAISAVVLSISLYSGVIW